MAFETSYDVDYISKPVLGEHYSIPRGVRLIQVSLYCFGSRSNLSVLSLCLKERPKRKIGPFFVWLAMSLPYKSCSAYYYITSEVSRTIRLFLFIVQTSDRDIVISCPILPVILQFFTE